LSRIERYAPALLAVTSILLSLGVCELALRLLFPCPIYGYASVPPQEQFFQYDPRLGWRGRPDATGVSASVDFRVRVTHDRLGHRTSAEPWAADRRNILVVGDSYAWGWGVEDGEVFSERMMRLRGDLNVYNLAAPGYGTDQEYLLLREFLETHPEVRPETVVLVFFVNDWADNASTSRYGYPKPRFRLRGDTLELQNVPVPDMRRADYARGRSAGRAETTLLNRSHLYNLASRALYGLPLDLEAVEHSIAEEATEEQLAISLRLLRAVRNLAASRGAELLVVLLHPGDTPQWRTFRARIAAAGIASLPFSGRRWLGSTQLWVDGHLNRRGHDLLAVRVVEALDRR
jgi:hypothetical protein